MNPSGVNRLREVRETRGLSQVDLARQTGLTRQALHSIESDPRVIQLRLKVLF